jgi:hypothetical protein
MAADELRTYIDEQEGLLESMQGSASKAELKQQKGLITLARRDLKRMQENEAVAPKNVSSDNAGSEKQSYNHKNFMELRQNSETAVDRAFSEKTLSGIGAYLRGEGKSGRTVFNPDAKDATAEDIAFAAQSLKEIKEIQEPLLDKASKTILDFDNGRANADATIKGLRSIRNSLKREAVKADAKQKADGHWTESKSENTVRSMTYYTKARHLDIVAGWVDGALATIVAFNRDKGNYPMDDMSKAKSFSSRSEAGRYAANMRWRGRTGDLTTQSERDYATYGELTAEQATEVERRADEMYQSTGLYVNPVNYYSDNPSFFDFKPPAYKAPGGVDRGRDILDNETNDNGDSVDDLNSRYWEGDEYIPFEELPKGGFREQVIAAFIDAKAAGYYDEPGRLRGPYDRPSNKMTDKGYAKARAHALKGNMDNSPSDLDEYWDDNSSIFWDEYAGITDQYPKDE